MAMMKYGRTTKTSTLPEKAPRKIYTEQEYLNREKEIKDWEKRKADYDENQKNYLKELEYYQKGPGSTQSSSGGISLTKGKSATGQDITFSSAGVYSAEKLNKEAESKIKSGEFVKWNDPSIDANTRKIILGTMGSNVGAKDVYGKPDEYYIPKGTKFNSYKDVYGVDFNPEEWEAAEKTGPQALSDYIKKKGYKGKTFTANTGILTHYQAPVKQEFNEKKPEPISDKEVMFEMPKLSKPKLDNPALKKSLVGATSKSTKTTEPTSPMDWYDPTPKKSLIKLDIQRQGGQKNKWNLRKKITPGSGDTSPSVRFNKETGLGQAGLKYKIERRGAKAFYAPKNERGAGGYYAMSNEGFVPSEGGSYNEYMGVKNQMKQKIKELKSQKKDFRKDTDLKGSEKRSEMKARRTDLWDARFAKLWTGLGKITPEGDETWVEGPNSKLKYYTPDTEINKVTGKLQPGAMYNYVNSAKSHIEKAGEWQKYGQANESNYMTSLMTKRNKAQEYKEKVENANKNVQSIKNKLSLKYPSWDKKIR
jgi:hypothetical protein